MKQWRVGTLSMGVTLVMLGVLLFSSQWRGLQAIDTFIAWWPLIFVLLGLELLIYIAVSRLSSPVVKYDIFSILFVGLICIVCIGSVGLTSTGLLQEIRYEINSLERTETIPTVEEKLQAQVKKIVVQNHNWSEIIVTESQQETDQAVHVFGSYRYSSSEGEADLGLTDSIVSVRTVGDTIYVNIEQPPRKNGINSRMPHMNVTVVIPEGITADITGNHKLI